MIKTAVVVPEGAAGKIGLMIFHDAEDAGGTVVPGAVSARNRALAQRDLPARVVQKVRVRTSTIRRSETHREKRAVVRLSVSSEFMAEQGNALL